MRLTSSENIVKVLNTGIYKITMASRDYYGQSEADFGKLKSQTGLHNRRRGHLGDLKRGDHGNPFMQRSYDGWSLNTK